MRIIYWFFSKILTLGILAFFKKIDIVGKNNVPKTGPLIICSNHPNMAMDPVLVSATCGRDDGHYWAMAPLFEGPQGNLLRALGAIPVQRREDNAGNAVNNFDLFKSSFEVLDQDKCLFIFPEGKSYTDSKLQPIRTGAVRLVLDHLKRTGGAVSVPILPCGINYARKDKFRSEILVYYGKPIIIPNEVITVKGEIADGFDEKQMVQEYTRTLEKRLKQLTINAPDYETLQLIATTRRLYVNGRNLSLEQWVKVTRRVSKLYEEHIDKPEMVTLKGDIAKYQELLDSFHLRDAYFTHNISMRDLSRFLLTRFLALLIIAPFAAVGALLHSPIYIAAAYMASEKITPYTESKTMVKLGVSAFVTVPLMYSIALFSVLYIWGMYPFVASIFVLPLLGLAHLQLVEQGVLLGRSVLPLIRLMGLVVLGFRNVLEDISDQRKVLIKRINEVIKLYHPFKKNVLPLAASSGKSLRYDHDEQFI